MSTLTVGRRRRPTKGDRTEAAILDSAWELLARHPLSAITIEDLAHGAGISRSSLYFHFESKDAVIAALAGRVATDVHTSLSALFVGSDTASADDVRRSVKAYLVRWREKGAVLRAMATLAESDTDLRAFWAELTDQLLDEAAAVIESERRAGCALPAPPAARDLARVLFATLWRTGYEVSLTPPSAAEERRIVDTVTLVIIRSVYGTNAS